MIKKNSPTKMAKNMPYPPRINPKKEATKITAFIKNTFTKAGKSEAVIAASGGIDSSTTLILAARALGPQHLHVLHLPARTTNPQDLADVKRVMQIAQVPGKNLTTIPVTAIIQKTWRIINHYTRDEIRSPNAKRSDLSDNNQNPSQNSKSEKGAGSQFSQAAMASQAQPDWQNSQPTKTSHAKPSAAKKIVATRDQEARLNRLRLANIAARARMVVLYDQAKLHDALVIGTENRSEHLLGYYTRFGDEASDIEPIKLLYKMQLLTLANDVNVPKEIIAKPPTAGLWAGQTDAEELGFSYEEADPILYLHFDKKMSSKEIGKILVAKTRKQSKTVYRLVNQVLNWAASTEFKHQLPYSL